MLFGLQVLLRPMDDLCLPYFTSGQCPGAPCCQAHNLQELANLDLWVFMPTSIAPTQVIETGEADRHYIIAGHSTLIRCRSPAHVWAIVNTNWHPHQPISLIDWLAHGETSASLKDLPPTVATATSAATSSTNLSSATTLSPYFSLTDEGGMAGVFNLVQDFYRRSLEPYERQAIKELSREFHDISSGPPTPSAPSPTTSSPIPPHVSPSQGVPESSPKVWSKQGDKERSDKLLQLLRQQPLLGQQLSAGWEAVRLLLGVRPELLDADVLNALHRMPPNQREQILLSLAAIGFHGSSDPSHCLRCIMQDHTTVAQVCLYFLVDQCLNPDCPFVHPHRTPGWDLLAEKWSKSFRDFDYPVLSYLAKKAPEQQEAILLQLAEGPLDSVQNLSAYLSVLIFKTQKRKKGSPTTAATSAPRHSGPTPPPGHLSGPQALRSKGKGRQSQAASPRLRFPAAVDSPPQRGTFAPSLPEPHPMGFALEQKGTSFLAVPFSTLPAVMTSPVGLGSPFLPIAALDMAALVSPRLPTQSRLVSVPSSSSVPSSRVSSVGPLVAPSSSPIPPPALAYFSGQGALLPPSSRLGLAPTQGDGNRLSRP
eukprot:GGOE01054943.1.p1 GENE.GGOE01054943.1~~GGOE01054943.1.p1  ORF type:complete len:594 (+),score=101.98 GGOE01054943.1:26-1807(+)